MEFQDSLHSEAPPGMPAAAEDTSSASQRARSPYGGSWNRRLKLLWSSNKRVHEILKYSESLEETREKLFQYLEEKERFLLHRDNELHALERANARECMKVFKSIIGSINEKQTGFSALKLLFDLAHNIDQARRDASLGFLVEFIHLFRGVRGHSGIYGRRGEMKELIPQFLRMKGRKAAQKRTVLLDHLSENISKYFRRYPSGLEEEVVRWRRANRDRILEYFGSTEADWNDWKWHLDHVIKNPAQLNDLLELSEDQERAVAKAVENKIPFGITPYYLGLMDYKSAVGYDHAIRAQVVPPPDYVDKLAAHKADREECFDFMREHDTSPVDLVTRRYPSIAILKPYNTCSQICVYCQRNWEIDECMDPKAMAPREKIDAALAWFDQHPEVGEVLVTGGDPMVTDDEFLGWLVGELAKRKHIFRIRFGTRTPVVLPQRWTDNLINVLAQVHEPGVREVCIVTHFAHSYEITPEAMTAVQKIRRAGMGVYNQAVFTMENSRRFETCKLRRDMRLIGVDPYYTFNMKGKDETQEYMVPIARILQERKEEARLMPGLDRTDEAVYNVPRLGKNHLRAWQDHRIIMIRADGARVYEFHPWEKNIAAIPPYNHEDVPLMEYLTRLSERGEDVEEYRSIWYYY